MASYRDSAVTSIACAGLVQIVNNDGAGFESHDGNLSYSLFIRLGAYSKWLVRSLTF